MSLSKYQALSIKRKTAKLYSPGPLDSASVSGPGWYKKGQGRTGRGQLQLSQAQFAFPRVLRAQLTTFAQEAGSQQVLSTTFFVAS